MPGSMLLSVAWCTCYPPRDPKSYLLTRRHWALRSMDGGSPRLASAVRLELEQRQRSLEGLRRHLESALARWESRSGTIVVPDTNVFLHQAQPIDELPWFDIVGSDEDVHVVIPLIVIDELDNPKKHNNKKLQRAARHSIRRLHSLAEGPTASSDTTVTWDGMTVTIEVLADVAQHRRLADSDYEILDRAAFMARLTLLRVCVVTGNLGMQVRAAAMGIPTAVAPEDDENE